MKFALDPTEGKPADYAKEEFDWTKRILQLGSDWSSNISNETQRHVCRHSADEMKKNQWVWVVGCCCVDRVLELDLIAKVHPKCKLSAVAERHVSMVCVKANMAWLTPCPLKPNASNVAWLTICPLKPNATKSKIMQSHVTVCTAHWFSLGLAGCSAWDLGPAAGAIFLVTVYPRAFVPTTVDIHSCVGNPRVTSRGIAFLLLLCLFGGHISSLLEKKCDIILFLTCPNNLYRTQISFCLYS